MLSATSHSNGLNVWIAGKTRHLKEFAVSFPTAPLFVVCFVIPTPHAALPDSPTSETLLDLGEGACEEETVHEVEALISSCFNRLQQRGIPYVDAASQVPR